MGNKVEWDKVEKWLKAKGARLDPDPFRNRSPETGEQLTYKVTRGRGPWSHTTTIEAASFVVRNADGTRTESPHLVARRDVADVAAELEIPDASEVLGPNWENEFPRQARRARGEADEDDRDGDAGDLIRPRRGSLREPPDGPFEKEHEGNGDSEEEEGEGEVR